MITRSFSRHGYSHGCDGAPPPLHVYSEAAEHAAWHPLGRPDTPAGHHPGPVMVTIPQPAAAQLGDDPTDPAAQTMPRIHTAGMVGRLHPTVGGQ
jgi:hypothetical protein